MEMYAEYSSKLSISIDYIIISYIMNKLSDIKCVLPVNNEISHFYYEFPTIKKHRKLCWNTCINKDKIYYFIGLFYFIFSFFLWSHRGTLSVMTGQTLVLKFKCDVKIRIKTITSVLKFLSYSIDIVLAIVLAIMSVSAVVLLFVIALTATNSNDIMQL